MKDEINKSPEMKDEDETKSESNLSDQELNGVSGGAGTVSLHSMEVEPVDFRPKGLMCGMDVEPVDFRPKLPL